MKAHVYWSALITSSERLNTTLPSGRAVAGNPVPLLFPPTTVTLSSLTHGIGEFSVKFEGGFASDKR